MAKLVWTEELINQLIELYPNMLNRDIAKEMGIKESSVVNKSCMLGLKKCKEFLREVSRENANNPNHGGRKTRFKKGMIPANKGMKQEEFMSKEALERSIKGRFKKGRLPHNTKPLHSERVTKDGYVEIKIFDEAKNKHRYVLKHRYIWEKHNGKIKRGELIVFRDGDSSNLNIENLEKITLKENMNRNTIHNYPSEVKETIRLKSKIVKLIKEKK